MSTNGNAYLEYDKSQRKEDDTRFVNGDATRLLNNAFAETFKAARGSDIDHNKRVGQILMCIRFSNVRMLLLPSYLDKMNKTEAETDNASSKLLFIGNYTIESNKEKLKGQLALE